jgi:uncharacterized protein YbaP (TraB family)
MKKILLFGLVLLTGTIVQGQPAKKKSNSKETEKTLLWKVTGNGLSKPSYLFGTMHLLCADDIIISDSLTMAIKQADNVYLELDMDNFMEMMSAMTQMTMRNDTTLADLLSKEDYEKVKKYFEENSSMLPFSMLETYKPLLATSLIMEQKSSGSCNKMISMEQLVMKEARNNGVKVKGIETMMYQISIFDSIPYKFQAEQLLKMIEEGAKDDGTEMKLITDAYRQQDLSVMEEMTKKADMGIENFTDLLLYNRNRNWAEKLKTLMPDRSLVVAVGAGHLPGEQGLINLLKKAGYKVEPVKNDMIRKKTKEI